MTVVSIPFKYCSRKEQCLHPDGPHLPATAEYFYADKRIKSGLCARCKACVNDYNRHWATEHPEQIQKIKRRYKASNVESIRLSNQQYHADNKQKDRERLNKWRKDNPEKRKVQYRNRNTRKRNAEGTITLQDVELQIKAQTNKNGQLICWLCGKPIKGKYHVDHWIPLDKQGSNNAGNLRILHPRCNLTKSNKLPWKHNGRLI